MNFRWEATNCRHADIKDVETNVWIASVSYWVYSLLITFKFDRVLLSSNRQISIFGSIDYPS